MAKVTEEEFKKVDWFIYTHVCKDRFDKIEEKIENMMKEVTNHLPTKIDNVFWKLLSILVPLFAGLAWIVVKYIVNGG